MCRTDAWLSPAHWRVVHTDAKGGLSEFAEFGKKAAKSVFDYAIIAT